MAKKKNRSGEGRGPLRPNHKLFALIYLGNGNNARAAYNEAMPGKRKDSVTDACASRLLSSAKVKAFIQERGEKILAVAEATAEEAMAVISRVLRIDPRLMLDKTTGLPLPMKDWPEDVALVVKGIKADGSIVFYDKMRAAELIAESHGRIKKKLDISLAFDHVKYLADKSRPKE
jgi:phage terminase small subunit